MDMGPLVKWGRVSGMSKADQTVLARLMECQIWHQLAGFVALWLLGEGLEKGQWPLLAFKPDILGSPSMPLAPFKLLPLCWSSERVSLTR